MLSPFHIWRAVIKTERKECPSYPLSIQKTIEDKSENCERAHVQRKRKRLHIMHQFRFTRTSIERWRDFLPIEMNGVYLTIKKGERKEEQEVRN